MCVNIQICYNMCKHKNMFQCVKNIKICLKTPENWFFSQKIGTKGCSIYETIKYKVLAWPLVDIDSYSLLSVKESLCTIFSGTPCT